MTVDPEQLPDDPEDAQLIICGKFRDFMEDGPRSYDDQDDFDWGLREFYGILLAVNEVYGWEFELADDVSNEKLAGTCQSYFKEIEDGIRNTRKLRQFSETRLRYTAALGGAFAYEFSKSDLQRVKTLINELRDQITTCDEIDQNHKQRILRRLERLQQELHKRVSDLDRFWGLGGLKSQSQPAGGFSS